MDADFEQLYNTYYMQVYSFVMALGNSRALAEEVTQKTFFKAMTTSSRHRGESSELTWLCAIAKNLLADEARASSRIDELSEDAASVGSLDDSLDGIPDGSLESRMIDENNAFHIHRVLHDLAEPYKEVFQLRVFGELPFRKIGMLFGKTENWARVTYHRARLKIQERMD